MPILHKSVYDPIEAKDGYRLLVTRFWPRGIKKSAVDSWEQSLGAPLEVIRKKKTGRLTMAELKTLYAASLDREALEKVLSLARREKVTLLCTCRDELCHRVILAEILKRRLKRKRAC